MYLDTYISIQMDMTVFILELGMSTIEQWILFIDLVFANPILSEFPPQQARIVTVDIPYSIQKPCTACKPVTTRDLGLSLKITKNLHQ